MDKHLSESPVKFNDLEEACKKFRAEINGNFYAGLSKQELVTIFEVMVRICLVES